MSKPHNTNNIMIRRNFYITQAQAQALQDLKRKGLNASAIVREAIDYVIETRTETAEEYYKNTGGI